MSREKLIFRRSLDATGPWISVPGPLAQKVTAGAKWVYIIADKSGDDTVGGVHRCRQPCRPDEPSGEGNAWELVSGGEHINNIDTAHDGTVWGADSRGGGHPVYRGASGARPLETGKMGPAKFVSANNEWIYAIAKETTEGCAECAWSCKRPCPADGSGWQKSGVSEPLRYVHVGVLEAWAVGITGGLLHRRLDAPSTERWTTMFDAHKRFVSIASNEWYVFGTTTVG